jgi:murein L,D-transpeptidase YcbB/YkuD
MTHLILKPYWHVPRSIIDDEILTLSDPAAYVDRNKISLIDQGGQIISGDSINWEAAKPGSFPYRLRQEPGSHNSLGLIKFMFPNSYAVYIHDTPAKRLFEKEIRTFSHGCIRLEKPFELAEYLLQDFPKWDLAALEEATTLEEYNNHRINLPNPLPVYVLYWTAWMDHQEHVHFREDIYQRDQAVWQALKQPIEIAL